MTKRRIGNSIMERVVPTCPQIRIGFRTLKACFRCEEYNGDDGEDVSCKWQKEEEDGRVGQDN